MKIFQLQNDFQNSAVRGPQGDLNDCLLDRQNYTDFQVDARSLFPSVYLSIFGDNHCVLDVTAYQIYLIRNWKLKIIAGQYGVAGLRNGAGSQAILGCGGFQSAFATVTQPNGDFLWTDTETGTIRMAHEEADGTWTVSTFAKYNTTSLCNDATGNIYTVQGSTLIQILPGGGTKNFALPWGNILSIRSVNDGRIVLLTRNNAWDIVFDYHPATGKSNRLCGVNDSEIAAYCARVGINADQYFSTNHDGPALGVPGVDDLASFHSPTFAYVARDGSEIWLGGSDERQLRRWLASTGRVDSLFPDGVWRETKIRTLQDHSDPGRPQFVVAPGGKTPDGWFWDFGRQGGHTSALIAVLTEVTTQPPPQGGTVIKNTLDGVDAKGIVRGWNADSGKLNQATAVTIKIDGGVVATITTDKARPELKPSLDGWFGTAVDSAAPIGFEWAIPESFKDNVEHALAISYAGGSLWQSPMKFKIAPVVVEPPPPPPDPDPPPPVVKVRKGRIVLPKEFTIEIFADDGTVEEQVITTVEIEP